jgi:hypothetical protein
MIGSEGVGQAVAAWLEYRLPTRLRILEARLGLQPGELVDPSLIEDHETGPIAIEQWPAIYALPQKMSDLKVVETAEGDQTYRVTYPVRILAWVRANDYGTTDLLRKRYALAIREALLERKQLTPAPEYGGPGWGDHTAAVTINPASIREDYSGLVDDQSGATIAGTWVDVDVTFTETLEGAAPLGQVADFELSEHGDTRRVPPHPGL